jgi:hypothetical protein
MRGSDSSKKMRSIIRNMEITIPAFIPSPEPKDLS